MRGPRWKTRTLEKLKKNVQKQMTVKLQKEVDRTQQNWANLISWAKAPPGRTLTEHRERLQRETHMIQLLQQALDQIKSLYTLERNRIERP